MIITLVKADFSANNIGTLSSFNVYTQFESGCQYNGALNIPNGERLSAVIAVDAKYAIENVTVSMGGVELPNAATIQGLTIVIDIPAVTGNIVIDVDTEVEGPEGIVLFNAVVGAPAGGSYGAGSIGFIEPAIVPANTWVDHVDVIAVQSNKTQTEPIVIDGLQLFTVAVNSKVAKKVVDLSNYTSIMSDKNETAGMQIFRIPVEQKFKENVYIGITAITANNNTAPTIGYAKGASPLGDGKSYMGKALEDGGTYALTQSTYHLPLVIYG